MINEENRDEIFVQTAGLVIVGPFLKKCFTLVDYLDENFQFKDEESRNRAVYLLHFIATGEIVSIAESIPEHLLTMPKVLCGMSIEQYLPNDISLTEIEIGTAMELLENAVLGNWEMMRNSSVENLRGAFLIRDGKLEETTDSFELLVENKTYDIVLEHIPWSMKSIQLPWLDKIIEVSW